jgi:hypothetical protein
MGFAQRAGTIHHRRVPASNEAKDQGEWGMTILMDTVVWDANLGMMLFQVSHEGKTFKVRFSDVYLQDGFSCQDPETEYQACVAGNTETFLAQVLQKYESGSYSDGATLDFLDF